jgi:hypothetical protein
MRPLSKVTLIVAMIWTGMTQMALAQTNWAAIVPIIENYVSSLQNGNIQALGELSDPLLFQQVMLQTTGNGVYPILRDLGPISHTQIRSSVSPFNFIAEIRHQRGVSEWQFVLQETRPVINGAQAVSFSGDRQANLTFGAVSVHVPQTHRIGRIELPLSVESLGIRVEARTTRRSQAFCNSSTSDHDP